jgi:putative transposase
VRPAQKRAVVRFFRAGFRVSERRACRVAGVPRSTCRYRSVAKDQTALRVRLRDLAAARARYGYRRLHVLLRREGWKVNHKRVYRLYREEGLGIRVKRRRKRVSGPRVLPPPAQRPHERWSIDFLADGLVDGRRFRVLTIVDNVSRVSPAIEVATSLTGERVVAVLERLRRTVGVPDRIAIDNGPEFVSKALDAWAYGNGVQLEFSRPGKPTDNAYVESFNGHFRAECLDQHWFASLEEARQTIEAWRVEYNTERPHRALGQQTPAAVEAAWQPRPEAPSQPIKWTNPGGRSPRRGLP